MKAVKLSLAAALVASSAFAVDLGSFKDVKVGGQLKAWYETTQNEAESTGALFSQGSARGQAMAKVTLDGKIGEKIGFGATGVYIDTLGLENNLVADVAVAGVPGGLKSQQFMQEAFMTYATHKTIAKIGRQKLDTPLAFSEDWNLVENSFEAAVLINKDLPDTILVGAYVSEGNGNGAANKYVIADQGKFSSYVLNGARAVGAINTSIQGVTAQAWYYDVVSAAKAFWVDLTYNVPSIATVEAMYAHMEPTGVYSTGSTTDAYAAKVSGSVANVNLAASYANIGDGFLPVGNTATGFATTKVYTAGVGGSTTGFLAGAADSTSWKVEASTKVADVTLGTYYNAVSVGDKGDAFYGRTYKNQDVSSVALTAAVKVDEVNLMAAYISESNDKLDDNQIVRVIASINF